MKKIISLIAVVLLLPFLALADSVDITSVTVQGSIATINGVASGVTEVSVDNVVAGTSASPFSVVKSGLSSGNHTAKAVTGTAEDTQSFFVPSVDGGGLVPCQIEHTCVNYGLSAPTIPQENFGVMAPTASNYTKTGELVTIFNLFQLIAKGLI